MLNILNDINSPYINEINEILLRWINIKTIDNINRIKQIIDDENHIFHDEVKDVVYSDRKLSVPKGKEVQLLNAISDAFYRAVFSETDNVDGSRI